MEKNETLFIAGEDVNWSGCFGKQFGISQKIKNGVCDVLYLGF